MKMFEPPKTTNEFKTLLGSVVVELHKLSRTMNNLSQFHHENMTQGDSINSNVSQTS